MIAPSVSAKTFTYIEHFLSYVGMFTLFNFQNNLERLGINCYPYIVDVADKT